MVARPPRLSTAKRREIASKRKRDDKGHFASGSGQINNKTNYLQAQVASTGTYLGQLGPAAVATIAEALYNYGAGRVRLKRLGLKASATLGQVKKKAAAFNKNVDKQSQRYGKVKGALYRTAKHVWV